MTRCACGGLARVVWTQRTADGISVRRRHCEACDRRWYGAQAPEFEVPSFALNFNRGGPVLLNEELLTLRQRQLMGGSQDESRREPV